MLPERSVFNIRIYAETPRIAHLLRDAIAESEPGFQKKDIHSFSGPNATGIQRLKGLTYLEIEGVTPNQMACIIQHHSGISGMTYVTKSGLGVHETDVTDTMRNKRLVVATPRRARAAEPAQS